MNQEFNTSSQRGSIELIVLGLLAALIVVLAIPLLSSIVTDHKSIEPPSDQNTGQST